MSRKDYEAIAAAFRRARDMAKSDDPTRQPLRDEGIDLAVGCIASALQSDNPRFDGARFLAACEEVK